jgi:hypothetical protein
VGGGRLRGGEGWAYYLLIYISHVQSFTSKINESWGTLREFFLGFLFLVI